jgi:hypothetical protein
VVTPPHSGGTPQMGDSANTQNIVMTRLVPPAWEEGAVVQDFFAASLLMAAMQMPSPNILSPIFIDASTPVCQDFQLSEAARYQRAAQSRLPGPPHRLVSYSGRVSMLGRHPRNNQLDTEDPLPLHPRTRDAYVVSDTWQTRVYLVNGPAAPWSSTGEDWRSTPFRDRVEIGRPIIEGSYIYTALEWSGSSPRSPRHPLVTAEIRLCVR